MAKKSRKQRAGQKKDNAGCMSRFISMLGFHQCRYTRKSLSDKMFGSNLGGGTICSRSSFDAPGDTKKNHDVAIDANAKPRRINSRKASIKALLEEEMSEAYTSSEVKVIKFDTVNPNNGYVQTDITSDHDSNDSLASRPTCPSTSGGSNFDVDLVEMMAKLCCEPDQQYSLENSILQKAVGDFREILLDRKFMDTRLSISNEESRSREFMDALEMLSSNKELFLKLLEKHNARATKHIVERSRENGHIFFEEEKSKEVPLKRIIVLKPNTERNHIAGNPENGRASCHFSLKEVKKRLRYIMQRSIAMDGVLHKVPYGVRNPMGRPQTKWEENRIVNPLYKENEVTPTTKPSITLGRILELPEYKFLPPRRSKGLRADSSEEIRRLSSQGEKVKCETNSDTSPLTLGKRVYETEVPDLGTSSHTTQLRVGEGLIQKGNNAIEECDNAAELTVPGSINENCKEEGSFLKPEFGPDGEQKLTAPATSFSSNSVVTVQENPQENIRTRDRLCLVSVLQPLSLECVRSPDRMTTVHEAMCFDQNDTSLRDDKICKLQYTRTSLDRLPDTYVYDKVKILFGQRIDDSRLLFDCINEILVEIRERYPSCTPKPFLVAPNVRPIPTRADLVREVCKRLDRLLASQAPCVLQKTWMNRQLEAEMAIAEIGEVVIDYILEETILELWD